MHTKTMEGLVGAKTNMDLLQTPFRVFKDARRRGDQATMERAMDYVSQFSDKAEEYQSKAEEGMKEDAREASEKAELEQEKAIRRRKEEREEQEKRAEEKKASEMDGKNTDTVEISADGKVLLKGDPGSDQAVSEDGAPDRAVLEPVNKREPVIYTKTAEAGGTQNLIGTGISVSV